MVLMCFLLNVALITHRFLMYYTLVRTAVYHFKNYVYGIVEFHIPCTAFSYFLCFHQRMQVSLNENQF